MFLCNTDKVLLNTRHFSSILRLLCKWFNISIFFLFWVSTHVWEFKFNLMLWKLFASHFTDKTDMTSRIIVHYIWQDCLETAFKTLHSEHNCAKFTQKYAIRIMIVINKKTKMQFCLNSISENTKKFCLIKDNADLIKQSTIMFEVIV